MSKHSQQTKALPSIKRNSIWYTLLSIIVCCIAIYFIIFKSLGCVTKHGEEIKVIDVMGKPIKAAVKSLEDLGFNVVIDSAFDKTKKPLIVLNQVPKKGSVVKEGRTIYLTINRSDKPLVDAPNIIGSTYRSAIFLLHSGQLELGDTTHKPDIAKGAVLEMYFGQKKLYPGAPVPIGSKIDLVIGAGLGEQEFQVPDVLGMTVQDAITVLEENGLMYTAISDDPEADQTTGIVYMQTPNALNELNNSNKIRPGDVVDLRYKSAPTEQEILFNRYPAKQLEKRDSSNIFRDDLVY